MFFALVLLLIFLPLLECLLLWVLSEFISWIYVLLLVVATGFVGAFLARHEWRFCWRELNERFDRGEQPTETVIHALLILFAGVLLITPGLITDAIGLALLIPPIRRYGMRYAIHLFHHYRQQTKNSPRDNTGKSPDVIDID